jgi:hypothetical protein
MSCGGLRGIPPSDLDDDAARRFIAAAVSAIGAILSTIFAAIALRGPQPAAAVPEPVVRHVSPAPPPRPGDAPHHAGSPATP